jgi:organic radical activating enzyme
MIVKDIIVPDFVNYKKPSLFVLMPNCSFKCDKENGNQYCQNWPLVKQPNIEISSVDLIEKYYNKENITESVVFGGLEPFDSWKDLYEFIYVFRQKYKDDIVIYTGYNEDEIKDKINCLKAFDNIIVKFGRYKPNEKAHFDELLGVNLASNNQYAIRIS